MKTFDALRLSRVVVKLMAQSSAKAEVQVGQSFAESGAPQMQSFAESEAPQLQSVVDLVTPQLCRTDILGFEPVLAKSDIDSLAAQIPTALDKSQLHMRFIQKKVRKKVRINLRFQKI